MRQKHVLTALAIFAVTGGLTFSSRSAEAWWVGVSDRHVVDRGGLGWNPWIHTVQDLGAPRIDNPEYQTMGHPRQGPVPFTSDDPSRRTRESGSSSNVSPPGPSPSDSYSQNRSDGVPTGPYGATIYGAGPTTPSADPLVKELSR